MFCVCCYLVIFYSLLKYRKLSLYINLFPEKNQVSHMGFLFIQFLTILSWIIQTFKFDIEELKFGFTGKYIVNEKVKTVEYN